MTLRRPSFSFLMVCVVLGILCPAPSFSQKMPPLKVREGLRIGDLAFDFTLKDLSGRSYSLKEFRGKQVVHVVFWATWCVPCIEEIPALRAAYEKHRQEGLEVLAVVVPMNQSKDAVREFVGKHEMPYPILWDEGMAVMNRYRIDSIPQNFLVDRDGVIRYAGIGLPPDYDRTLRSALTAAATEPSGTR